MFNDLQVLHASLDPFQYQASKYLTEQCLIKENKALISVFPPRYSTVGTDATLCYATGFMSCRLQ